MTQSDGSFVRRRPDGGAVERGRVAGGVQHHNHRPLRDGRSFTSAGSNKCGGDVNAVRGFRLSPSFVACQAAPPEVQPYYAAARCGSALSTVALMRWPCGVANSRSSRRSRRTGPFPAATAASRSQFPDPQLRTPRGRHQVCLRSVLSVITHIVMTIPGSAIASSGASCTNAV